MTDGAGNVVTLHDYEPYGVKILPNNPTSMPTDALPGTHLYTGQERDADTGLDNFHFRSYASTMGRFLSPDNLPGTPLNPQSFNLYAYVHGNPVNYNDPTGHWAGGYSPDSVIREMGEVATEYEGFFPGSFGQLTDAVDALMDGITGSQSTQSASQPGAQDKQTSSPTAGQQATKAQRQTLTNVVYNETSSLRPNPKVKPGQAGSAEDLANGRQAIAEIAERALRGGHPNRVASSALSNREASAIKAGNPHAAEAYGGAVTAAHAALNGSNISNGATQYRTRVGADVTTPVGSSPTNQGTKVSQHYGPFIEGNHEVVIVVAP